MNRKTTLGVVVTFISVWVVAAIGIAALWLIPEARVVALALASAALVATLLVRYFGWRGTMQRRILAEGEDAEHFDRAA